MKQAWDKHLRCGTQQTVFKSIEHRSLDLQPCWTLDSDSSPNPAVNQDRKKEFASKMATALASLTHRDPNAFSLFAGRPTACSMSNLDGTSLSYGGPTSPSYSPYSPYPTPPASYLSDEGPDDDDDQSCDDGSDCVPGSPSLDTLSVNGSGAGAGAGAGDLNGECFTLVLQSLMGMSDTEEGLKPTKRITMGSMCAVAMLAKTCSGMRSAVMLTIKETNFGLLPQFTAAQNEILEDYTNQTHHPLAPITEGTIWNEDGWELLEDNGASEDEFEEYMSRRKQEIRDEAAAKWPVIQKNAQHIINSTMHMGLSLRGDGVGPGNIGLQRNEIPEAPRVCFYYELGADSRIGSLDICCALVFPVWPGPSFRSPLSYLLPGQALVQFLDPSRVMASVEYDARDKCHYRDTGSFYQMAASPHLEMFQHLAGLVDPSGDPDELISPFCCAITGDRALNARFGLGIDRTTSWEEQIGVFTSKKECQLQNMNPVQEMTIICSFFCTRSQDMQNGHPWNFHQTTNPTAGLTSDFVALRLQKQRDYNPEHCWHNCLSYESHRVALNPRPEQNGYLSDHDVRCCYDIPLYGFRMPTMPHDTEVHDDPAVGDIIWSNHVRPVLALPVAFTVFAAPHLMRECQVMSERLLDDFADGPRYSPSHRWPLGSHGEPPAHLFFGLFVSPKTIRVPLTVSDSRSSKHTFRLSRLYNLASADIAQHTVNFSVGNATGYTHPGTHHSPSMAFYRDRYRLSAFGNGVLAVARGYKIASIVTGHGGTNTVGIPKWNDPPEPEPEPDPEPASGSSSGSGSGLHSRSVNRDADSSDDDPEYTPSGKSNRKAKAKVSSSSTKSQKGKINKVAISAALGCSVRDLAKVAKIIKALKSSSRKKHSGLASALSCVASAYTQSPIPVGLFELFLASPPGSKGASISIDSSDDEMEMWT